MTNPTPHGQVPEALRLAEQYDHGDPAAHGSAWKAAVCTELRRLAELEAQIEALSGVQALSAAPAGWKLVPEDATEEMVRATDKVNFANADTDGTMHNVWNVMLAATPTPTAEQQAQTDAVYAELPEPDFGPGRYLGKAIGDAYTKDQMRDFADRTHALRMKQAAPKAAPPRTALPEGWTDCTIEFGNDGPEVVAYGPKRMMTRLAKWLGKYFAQVIAEAAPKAAPGVGNSGFDHQTAADFLSGKTVSDEAVRKFVAASRWAHDERSALSATLLAMHGVLTSREAEIALLKKALLEAEAAPKQEAQEPLTDAQIAEMMRDTWGCASIAPRHALEFARAVEAEVRQQDDELIRQMLEVLEYVRNTPAAEYDSKAALSKAQAAITAARARLGEKT